jgi:hypothetical protein
MKTEIKYFLEQYPEFNNDNFKIQSIESHRYNGDYTINVFDYDYEDGEYVFLKSYWCKFWNNEAETTYQFEEEKFVRYNRIRVSIDDSDLVYGAHYDYNEDNYRIDYNDSELNDILGTTDYTKIENNVVDAWQKDNEQKVREEIARKILSGEIKLNFYCSDSDGWGAPYSQIQKIYKV